MDLFVELPVHDCIRLRPLTTLCDMDRTNVDLRSAADDAASAFSHRANKQQSKHGDRLNKSGLHRGQQLIKSLLHRKVLGCYLFICLYFFSVLVVSVKYFALIFITNVLDESRVWRPRLKNRI